MSRRRRAGVLLHVSALPGPFGIGDIGATARDFVSFLRRTGQRVWQVLPVGPAAKGNSPYTSLSAFAGNPLLISPQQLVEDGFLDEVEVRDSPECDDDVVDYEAVRDFKSRLLSRAFDYFGDHASAQSHEHLRVFNRVNHSWLEEYALFQALVDHLGEASWDKWDHELAFGDESAVRRCRSTLRRQIEEIKFTQFVFFHQWDRLHAFAKQQGIEIFGDLPIFVAYESADVWAHRDQFCIGDDGRPTVVAGVPPDYFSDSGQLWGNPLYRWDLMAEQGYSWWLERLRHALSLYDLIRIDHFRGFESCWEVPADAKTAKQGRWAKGPGADLFRHLSAKLGPLPLVAEDLGFITPEVHRLRDQLGFPGMRVLQFAYGDNVVGDYHHPESHSRNCVVYTGTHDNDTAVGWFNRMTPTAAEKLLEVLGSDRAEFHWNLIRLAYRSSADLAVVPMQDILGLGSEARMNIPGQPEGNWTWRLKGEMISPEIESRLHQITSDSGR